VPRGGARNRSGPQKTEGSRTSDRAGFSLTALPASYDGEAPEFPLPAALTRELEVWADVWTYPQAHYWAENPRLWRHLAMYVRNSVRTEDPESSAALVNVVMRYADDVGISEAGMKFHGLKVAEATTPAAATGPTEVEDDPRLRLVRDGSGG
jgi:hypothetical protein